MDEREAERLRRQIIEQNSVLATLQHKLQDVLADKRAIRIYCWKFCEKGDSVVDILGHSIIFRHNCPWQELRLSAAERKQLSPDFKTIIKRVGMCAAGCCMIENTAEVHGRWEGDYFKLE